MVIGGCVKLKKYEENSGRDLLNDGKKFIKLNEISIDGLIECMADETDISLANYLYQLTHTYNLLIDRVVMLENYLKMSYNREEELSLIISDAKEYVRLYKKDYVVSEKDNIVIDEFDSMASPKTLMEILDGCLIEALRNVADK